MYTYYYQGRSTLPSPTLLSSTRQQSYRSQHKHSCEVQQRQRNGRKYLISTGKRSTRTPAPRLCSFVVTSGPRSRVGPAYPSTGAHSVKWRDPESKGSRFKLMCQESKESLSFHMYYGVISTIKKKKKN